MDFTGDSRTRACLEGQHRARVQFWQQIWKRQYLADIKVNDYTGLISPEMAKHHDIEDLKIMIQKYGGTKERTPVHNTYAVTINPPTTGTWEEDLIKLTALVKDLKELKAFPKVIGYAYDQRSDDLDNIYGIHVHMMVEAIDYPSSLVKTIFQKMNNRNHYKEYSINRYCIDVKPCNTDWLEYIKGNKDSSKNLVVEVTRRMLEKTRMCQYYLS